jgi:uncharacterized membrane protein (DUF4010 family)
MTNTLVKACLAGWFGGKPLITYMAPGMLTILIVGSTIVFFFGFTHL